MTDRAPAALNRAFRLLLLFGVMFTCPAAGLHAQPPTADAPAADAVASDESARYEIRELHDPNGIGKFYMGREIARVMGFQGAPWLERDSREEEERISLLVKSLKLKPGLIVADIGAGSGVLTLPLAEQVTPGGTVIAVDVQQEMLDRLKAKLEELNVVNVRLQKGTQQNTGMKPESIDLALMVDVYHEFEFPYEMMRDIARTLKPGGRVVFVEYRKEDPTVPIKLVHKMTVAQVKREIERPEFGLRWKETIGVLPRQHIVVFEKVAVKDDASAPN